VPLLWNYVTLEAAIRYDWVETNDPLRRYELEKSLIFSDFSKPDLRDLELAVRKPARSIQAIRKLAVRTARDDLMAYHIGIFFHAARRLVDFNPNSPPTSSELARLAHILLSMAMVATLTDNQQDVKTSQVARGAGINIIEKESRTVIVENNPIHLPPQPFNILLYLFENADRVCTTQELVEAALAGKYDENYLHTLVGRVRERIEADPEQPRYVITERNVGYRLIKQPK
jgi:hypothetical protein